MTRVINAAHADGTRVVLTVTAFAWTTSQARVQKALLGSSAARRTLARQIVAAVRDRGADGVNLDFEPLARGYADEFVSLLRTIRSEFNRVRSGYQITYDTTAYIGNYPLEASVGKRAADAIFVMGYDYRIGSSSTAGSISPLSGSGYDLADTVRAYKRRVPGSRLILGIPWYGRAWSTATDKPRSRTLSGAKYGYSRAVNYEKVMDYVREHGRRWDRVEQSPYVVYRRRNCTKAYGCVTSWRQIWYEDAASMKRRYALVNDYGLRGAGMWALGYEGGRSELYKALADSFLVAHSAPTAGIRVLSASQRRRGVHRQVGRQGQHPDRLVRRPGVHQRRPVAHVAGRDEGDVGRVPRPHGRGLRVPGPRARRRRVGRWVRGAQEHDRPGRDPAPRLRGERRHDRARHVGTPSSRPGRSRPTATGPRMASACAGRTPPACARSSCACCGSTAASSARGRSALARPETRRGRGTARCAASACATGGTSCSSSARPAGGRSAPRRRGRRRRTRSPAMPSASTRLARRSRRPPAPTR